MKSPFILLAVAALYAVAYGWAHTDAENTCYRHGAVDVKVTATFDGFCVFPRGESTVTLPMERFE